MGVVLLGRDRQGRHVAIKVIRSQHASEPQFLTRFRREVAAAARVPRFCTAAVLDADLDAEQPYLVTEFVDGLSLHATVARDGPLRGSALDALAVGVAAALTAIHDAGVIHRDLKPGNVLLSPAGPRVIDFGIARAADATTHTLTGQVLGTPGYMAPEQVAGERVTPAADVFAWGGVVAFAASGDPPFGRNLSVPAALHRILHADPDLSMLEERLRPIVAAAMAKDPDGRPAAADLLERTLACVNRAEPSRAQAAAVLEQATVPAPAPTAVESPESAPTVPGPTVPGPTGAGSSASAVRPAGVPPVVPGVVARPPAAEVESATADGEPAAPAASAGTAGVAPGSSAGRSGWSSAGTGVGSGQPAVVRRKRRARRALLGATLATVLTVAGAIWTDPFGALGQEPRGSAGAPTQTTAAPTTTPATRVAAETVRLPDLRGQTAAAATAELERDGFTVSTSEQVSESADAGNVLRTEPEQDALVEPGATITLHVGAGPEEAPREWMVFKRLGGKPINESPIVTVDPSGNQREVGIGDSPDLTPDASRVAYVSLDDTFTGQITVVRPDGSEPRQITAERGGSVTALAWSPDGESIAYFMNTGGLYVIGADGTGRRQISAASGFELDWSPDGSQIVFRGTDSDQLVVVSVDGTGLRQLTNMSVGAVEPAWSPDGQTIAFSGQAGGIYAIGADGTGVRQVAGVDTWHPSWTPAGEVSFVRGDGAFSSFSTTTGPVYTTSLDGTGGETPVASVTAGSPVQWARE